MKQVILFIFLLGIIFMVSGFLELYFNSKQVKVEKEFRFVPRSVYEQLSVNNLEEQFSYMFNANDPRNNTNLV